LNVLEEIIHLLPMISDYHAPDSQLYTTLGRMARAEVERRFSVPDYKAHDFKPFGNVVFPYHKLGAVDSLDLLNLDELIILSFYWVNRKRYKRVVDIGANIGPHSIILSKCGFAVQAYEPDPKHYEILQQNLKLNNCANVQVINAAVSDKPGEAEFIRVVGNTTGSHLAGSKANPYGELDKFSVKLEAIGPIIDEADLIKLDAEGHEKEILLATKREHWLETDALVEIENKDNAALIYKHFEAMKINLFSQKNCWRRVSNLEGMPNSYREGTLFISNKTKIPWEMN